MRLRLSLFLLAFASFAVSLSAQKPKIATTAEVYHKIEKLNFLGTVLSKDVERLEMFGQFADKLWKLVLFFSCN